MDPLIKGTLLEARAALDALIDDTSAQAAIQKAGDILVSAFRRRSRVYSCGNGGSLSDAVHFAEELTGRFREDRAPLGAAAISDPGHLSCVGNDFGWEHVFSRYLQGNGRQGDVLFAVSTSGKSANVVKAAEYARQNGIHVIALTGKADSPLSRVCDVEVCVKAGPYSDRAQELHIKVIHILIAYVEKHLSLG